MSRQPEGVLKDACRGYAKIHNLSFWQIEGKGLNGIPDTIAGHHDRQGIVFIEFKTPTGVLSVQQEKRIAQLKRDGQRVAVVRTVEEYLNVVGITYAL